tara:strand:- start:418 stop:1209 length:792 start_codon:yes stop_codon:yes gene_type:complete
MSQPDKNISFLVAMPRSGNTLFASLMNQNPNVAVTGNSITLEIMKELYLLKKTDVFRNYPDHHSLDNVLNSVFDNYYKDWPQKYIIDRGPVTTKGNLFVMNNHFKRPIKCIVLLRDLVDVAASWIKYCMINPDNYIRNNSLDLDHALRTLMLDTGQIARNLKALEFLVKPENHHMACFIKYDDLISNPKDSINKVYEFLDIPKFEHDYKNLNQFKLNGLSYDDENVLGKDVHTIRTDGIYKVENEYKNMVPEWFINKYGHIKF